NPNHPPSSSSGSDTAVQKAFSTTPTPEYELMDRFLMPYLDASDEELESILATLETDLLEESKKPGNEDNPVIAYLHALYSQELYLIMKNDQAMHTAMNLPEGKALSTIPESELKILNDKYPRKQEMNLRLEHSILSCKQSLGHAWDMRPSEHTEVNQDHAEMLYADMLYRRAEDETDPAEKQKLYDEADKVYKKIISFGSIDNGQKDELRFITVLRKAHQKYSPEKPFIIEHGTPREDLRNKKTDVKIIAGIYSFQIQLKTFSINDYVKAFNDHVVERTKREMDRGTLIVILSTPTLRDAYDDTSRVHLKQVIQQLIDNLGENSGDFDISYLIPPVKEKPDGEKGLTLHNVEGNVVKYTTARSLKLFGIPFEPTSGGMRTARNRLSEAITAGLEQGELHITKEMLTNPSAEVVASIRQFLMDIAA
ncbi:MAG: hypothetical protein UT02_C0005G0001, partial [Parcubacteria group bacterium GW2011_GWC2_38_7]